MTDRTARRLPWIIVGSVTLAMALHLTWLTAETLLAEFPAEPLWLHEIEAVDLEAK